MLCVFESLMLFVLCFVLGFDLSGVFRHWCVLFFSCGYKLYSICLGFLTSAGLCSIAVCYLIVVDISHTRFDMFRVF